jgi:tryptophan-rich sensory protein
MTKLTAARRFDSVIALVGWFVLCFAASATAVFVSIEGWYANLAKPVWNPPFWVFGPVWTTLYAMMAVAARLIWRQRSWKTQSAPLWLFLVQWLLNALWTPFFFGMHQIGLALADIIALWLTLAAMLVAFWKVKRAAGALLVSPSAFCSVAARRMPALG